MSIKHLVTSYFLLRQRFSCSRANNYFEYQQEYKINIFASMLQMAVFYIPSDFLSLFCRLVYISHFNTFKYRDSQMPTQYPFYVKRINIKRKIYNLDLTVLHGICYLRCGCDNNEVYQLIFFNTFNQRLYCMFEKNIDI